MEAWIKDLKERAEEVVTLRITASAQVETGPCLVLSISACGSSGTAGVVRLLDGVGSGAMEVVTFTTTFYWNQTQEYNPPLKMRQGLYLTIVSNITSVTVRYIPLRV